MYIHVFVYKYIYIDTRKNIKEVCFYTSIKRRTLYKKGVCKNNKNLSKKKIF